MKATEAIQFALQMSEHIVVGLIDDMKDAPLTFPTPRGGSHPLWVLGHLTMAEGVIREVLFGEPNPVESWKKVFNAGTEPVDDANAYPSFDEVRAKFSELRAQNVKLLGSLSDEDLDKPTKNPPEGLESFFNTYGKTFIAIAQHAMSHRGQVADARRVLGRKPIMM